MECNKSETGMNKNKKAKIIYQIFTLILLVGIGIFGLWQIKEDYHLKLRRENPTQLIEKGVRNQNGQTGGHN